MKTQDSLQVVYQKVADLKPYPRNTRTHSETQLKMLADSIRAFGFTNPALVDETNTIVAGHGRVEAAKSLGMTEIPTIRIDHLTDAEKRAYIIADNRIAEKAGWDPEMLALELGELLEIEDDLEVTITGFDMASIDAMLLPDPEPEEEPEVPTGPAVARRGDLWLLGDHRLYCGDALEPGSYQALLQGEKAQMVFTDPPYNVKIQGNVSGNGKAVHDEFVMASGEMSEDQFQHFLAKAAELMVAHSVEGSIHFVAMDWRHFGTLLAAATPHYGELKNLCVWNKNLAGMGSLYRSQHELILVFKNGTAAHINNVALGKHGRHRTNIWQYNSANTRGGKEDLLALHPTVKPVAMAADAMLDCSHRGGVVLDPFGGSGTTLMAAERVHRKARLLELDPKYIDTTIRRWQYRTGQHAILASTGVAFGQYKEEGRGDDA